MDDESAAQLSHQSYAHSQKMNDKSKNVDPKDKVKDKNKDARSELLNVPHIVCEVM